MFVIGGQQDTQIAEFAEAQAKEMISMIGKDHAIGALLQIMVDSIEGNGLFTLLDAEQIKIQQLVTLAVLSQVLNYEQIA